MVARTITVEEAALVLKRQPRTIRKWIASGRLRANKVGKSYIIPEAEVDKLINVGAPTDAMDEHIPGKMERLLKLQNALKGVTMRDYKAYTKKAQQAEDSQLWQS